MLGVLRRRLLPRAGATGASEQGLGQLPLIQQQQQQQQQQMQLPTRQALQQASNQVLVQRHWQLLTCEVWGLLTGLHLLLCAGQTQQQKLRLVRQTQRQQQVLARQSTPHSSGPLQHW
jgi:hypothetical protein